MLSVMHIINIRFILQSPIVYDHSMVVICIHNLDMLAHLTQRQHVAIGECFISRPVIVCCNS